MTLLLNEKKAISRINRFIYQKKLWNQYTPHQRRQLIWKVKPANVSSEFPKELMELLDGVVWDSKDIDSFCQKLIREKIN